MFKNFAIQVLVCLTFAAKGQNNMAPIIDFRQRFLNLKSSDDNGGEVVDSFRTLHIIIGGNIYQTEKHLDFAFDKQTEKYDFKNELKYIQPILNLGDVCIANLKTSFGNNVNNMFSSPDEFALALKYAGINALMHANIHTANVDKATLKRTRDLLYSFDIFHTGAFTDNMQRTGNYPLIINKKGFRIALLNYSNLPTRPSISRDFVINESNKIYLERDMRMAKVNKPDFTIVYFDWGTIGQNIPSSYQIDMAKYAFEQGADLVVGTDPNTPMRIDYVNYYYNGAVKEGIVAYSLGNLIASNEEMKNRNGYLLDMEIKKNGFTNDTRISDWGIIPVYTHYDTTTFPGHTKVLSVPCSGVENGDILGGLPYIDKRRVINSAYEVRKLLGSTADEIQYNLNEMVVNNVMESIHITQGSLNNKFSQKRENEIIPTTAPVLPVAQDGTNKTPSLAMLYTDAPSKPEGKIIKHTEPPKPTTPYEAMKQLGEQVFVDNATPLGDTVKRNEEIAIAIDKVTTPGVSKPTDVQPAVVEKLPTTTSAIKTDTVYRIQFYALNKFIPLDTNYYTHLKGYEVYEEDGFFKYLLGRYTSYDDCYKHWKSQIQPRYKQSFIVKYVSGKRYLK